MAKNTQPVLKRCKTLGLSPAVLGYSKSTKRQPKQTRRKQSEYGMQLNEKQKVKFIYGVLEKQFHHYYEKAERKQGITGEILLQELERRLDNVVFRMGFANTRREARQLVNHGHFTVNGKRVNIPSFQVKPGDVVAVCEKSRTTTKFKSLLEENLDNPLIYDLGLFGFLNGLGELGHDDLQVAFHAQVRHLHHGRRRVLIDGQDELRFLHAGQMLDRA